MSPRTRAVIRLIHAIAGMILLALCAFKSSGFAIPTYVIAALPTAVGASYCLLDISIAARAAIKAGQIIVGRHDAEAMKGQTVRRNAHPRGRGSFPS
jgi:hypothetical protein